mmetsp:Transcript_25799/g.32119  ORF Transcript_25799/g.32119 Transcript_25799/m.32119 type:complete len:161 (+) Transcript_25799:1526-2008(+)
MLIILGREKIFYPKNRIINAENFASNQHSNHNLRTTKNGLPEELHEQIKEDSEDGQDKTDENIHNSEIEEANCINTSSNIFGKIEKQATQSILPPLTGARSLKHPLTLAAKPRLSTRNSQAKQMMIMEEYDKDDSIPERNEDGTPIDSSNFDSSCKTVIN